MSPPPELDTNRLVLRALRKDDAADVFVFRSDPVVQRFNAEPLKTVLEAEAFLAELEQMDAGGSSVHWGIAERPNDRIIGAVSLNDIDRYHRRAAIGYDLAHDYWGRGIGREAVRAVLAHGFGTLGLHRIEASTIADNHESVRLLIALGFTQEALLREYSLEDDGVFHDSTIWALLKHEFSGG